MGYHVGIVSYDKKGNHQYHDGYHHTSNTDEIMREAGCNIKELDDTYCKNALPILNKTISTIETNMTKYEKMNSIVNWGTVNTTLRFLHNIADACKNHPHATIEVEW